MLIFFLIALFLFLFLKHSLTDQDCGESCAVCPPASLQEAQTRSLHKRPCPALPPTSQWQSSQRGSPSSDLPTATGPQFRIRCPGRRRDYSDASPRKAGFPYKTFLRTHEPRIQNKMNHFNSLKNASFIPYIISLSTPLVVQEREGDTATDEA